MSRQSASPSSNEETAVCDSPHTHQSDPAAENDVSESIEARYRVAVA